MEKMNKETRAFNFEVRAEKNEKHGTFITGVPIVFDQDTDMGWYQERIDHQALAGTDLKDVRFLIGHNTSMIPLARSRNNNENSTMQLTVTDRGMEIRVDLDTENNAEARALYSAVQRGDMSGMSFMFTVDTDKDIWEDTDTDYPKRTIMSIRKVFEVSAVAFPAYEQTDIQAASEGQTLDSVRASLESAKQKLEEERAAQAEAERRTALIERLNKITEVSDDEV
jgi:HK97 family phage prohead protease